MRCDIEFFGEAELLLLYMARRLREALQIEMILGGGEVDYFVEPGPYMGGLLFPRELTGAYFYVLPKDLARAKQLLARNNYKPFEQPVVYERKKSAAE